MYLPPPPRRGRRPVHLACRRRGLARPPPCVPRRLRDSRDPLDRDLTEMHGHRHAYPPARRPARQVATCEEALFTPRACEQASPSGPASGAIFRATASWASCTRAASPGTSPGGAPRASAQRAGTRETPRSGNRAGAVTRLPANRYEVRKAALLPTGAEAQEAAAAAGSAAFAPSTLLSA